MIFGRITHEEARERGLVRCYGDSPSSFVWQIVNEWSPRSDVYPLVAGPIITGVMAGYGSQPIISTVYRKYRLQNIQYGRLMYRIFPALTPAFLCMGIQFWNLDHLLQNYDKCKVCLELRSVVTQVAVGVAFPSVVAFSGMSVYLSQLSMKVPPFMSKEYILWVKEILSKSAKPITFSAVSQVLVAASFTYVQLNSWQHILDQLEKRIQNGETSSVKHTLDNVETIKN